MADVGDTLVADLRSAEAFVNASEGGDDVNLRVARSLAARWQAQRCMSQETITALQTLVAVGPWCAKAKEVLSDQLLRALECSRSIRFLLRPMSRLYLSLCKRFLLRPLSRLYLSFCKHVCYI